MLFILRLFADVVFYAITMPIRIVLMLVWSVWAIIDIITRHDDGINDVKGSIRAIKNTLRAERYWIKHG